MMTTTLKCIYDPRQSFYNKAHITVTPEYIKLISYSTEAARYDRDSGEIWVNNAPICNSVTTKRHVREFIKQIENGTMLYALLLTEMNHSSKK